MLLHGFPQTAACWTPLLDTLAIARYRAVAPDQRLLPRRPAHHGGGLPDARADRRRGGHRRPARRRNLPPGRPRLGGVVAWRLAGQQSERVATLTAVSTPTHGPSPGLWSPAPRRCVRPTSRCSASLDCPSCRSARSGCGGCAGCWPRTGWGPSGSTPTPVLWPSRGAPSAALAWYRAATPFSLRAPRVSVPTLYVWGSGDPALGSQAAITTGRWVTGAYRFEVFPGCRPLAARAPRRGTGSPAAGASAALGRTASSGGRAGWLTLLSWACTSAGG